jgi:hypothetical protein
LELSLRKLLGAQPEDLADHCQTHGGREVRASVWGDAARLHHVTEEYGDELNTQNLHVELYKYCNLASHDQLVKFRS